MMKNKLIAIILIALLIGLPLEPLLANGEEIVYIGENTVLNRDINGRVVITANNITLDCDGHKIIGFGDGLGVDLNGRNGVTIKNCIIENFETGILLVVSRDNQILNNKISDNFCGISLVCSSDNQVIENNILDNNIGIVLDCQIYSYSDNLIFHNNFINNINNPFGFQAYFGYESNEFFDNGYSGGGNYWSDYIGEDLKQGENQDDEGSDGIGDTPYVFYGDQDNYPFMEENGWQEETTGEEPIPDEILNKENDFYQSAKTNIEKIDTKYIEMVEHTKLSLTRDAFKIAMGSFAKVKILKEIEDELFKALLSEFCVGVWDKGVEAIVEKIPKEKFRIGNIPFMEVIENKHLDFTNKQIVLSPETEIDKIVGDIQEKQATVTNLVGFIDNTRKVYQVIEDAEGIGKIIKWGLYGGSGICLAVATFATGGIVLPVIAGGLFTAGKVMGWAKIGSDVNQAVWVAMLFGNVYKSELNITNIFTRQLDRVIIGLETAEFPVSEGEIVSMEYIGEGIKLGDTASFSAGFKNTGSIDTSANLLLKITDPNEHSVSYRSESKTVQADSEKSFTIDTYFPYQWCKGVTGSHTALFQIEHGIFPEEIHENITPGNWTGSFEVDFPPICFWKHIPFVAAGKSKAPVTIVLKNNTDLLISDIVVIDEIPKNLAATVDEIEFITPYTEIIEADPIIKWVVDLKPGETKEIKYQIEVPALDAGDVVEFPEASISYFDPETGEKTEQTSGGITIAVSNAAISLTEVIAPDVIGINEEFSVTAYIKNRGEINAEEVSANIILPEGLELCLGENLIELGALAEGESKNITWNVKATEIGAYSVWIEAYSNNAGDDFKTINLYNIPKQIKQEAKEILEAAKTGEKKIDKEIDKIINNIQDSLSNELWADASRLDTKHGKKVFQEEFKAVKNLLSEIKKKKTPANLLEVFKEVIDRLVKADEMIAKIAIEDAKLLLAQNSKKVNYEIEKAEEDLFKAYEELENNRPDKAIKNFEKSWEHAQRAIKHAGL